MGFSFFRKISKKLSEDKDYEEFVKAYTCLSVKGKDDASQSSPQICKVLKKKSVQLIILQDTAYVNKPAFVFDSFNPNKDYAKGSPSDCRFMSNGKLLDLADIVFGNIPLHKNSDLKSSMKIHFLQDGEQILISKILYGFRKQCSHTPTTSECGDPSLVLAATVQALAAAASVGELTRTNRGEFSHLMTSSGHMNIPGRSSNRNHSLSQSPSSVADLQFWSTSPAADTPLTPSQQCRITRSCRNSLHVKTRSLPSQNQMHTMRVDHQSSYGPRGPNCCGGGSGINLAICIILTPAESFFDDSPTQHFSTSSSQFGATFGGQATTSGSGLTTEASQTPSSSNASSSSSRALPPRYCSRFNAFLFKHFSQVEVLLQGLEERVASVLSTNGATLAAVGIGNGGGGGGSTSSSGSTPTRSQIIVERTAQFQKAKNIFLQGLNDLLTTPRLYLPVWLSLTATDWDKIVGRPHQQSLRQTFVKQCLVNIIAKLNCRDRAFFPSRLITGVLMYHLAWIPSVIPAGGKLAKKCLMKHEPKWADSMSQSNPYSPHWAQLSDLFGGPGSGGRMARTIVVGRNRSQVSSLLYLISYFLRCANVTQADERLPELGRADLYELQQARRVKLGNDSGISSQEDLAMSSAYSCSSSGASAGTSPTPRVSLALADPSRLTSGQCRIAEAAAMAAMVTYPEHSTVGRSTAGQGQGHSSNRPTSPDSCFRPGWNPWTGAGGGNGTGAVGGGGTTNLARSSASASCQHYVEIPLLFEKINGNDQDEGHFSEPDIHHSNPTTIAPTISSHRHHLSTSSTSHNLHLHHQVGVQKTGRSNSVGMNLGNCCPPPQPEVSLGHSTLAGFSSHYVNGFALQGTSQHESEFMDSLVADLRVQMRHSSSQDEVLNECAALIANVEDKTVQVVTVLRGSNKAEISEVCGSPFVMSMLDTVRSLSDRNTCSKLCLQHLETRLQEIYFLSHSLRDLLQSGVELETSLLASAIGVEEDDLPLLFHASQCSGSY